MPSYAPNEKIVITVEIRVNGTWTEITSPRRKSGNLRLRHGRSEGAIQAEASRCWVAVGNDDGYLTPGNPRSPWAFGEQSEIRVSVLGVAQFTGEVADLDVEFISSSKAWAHIEAIGLLGVVVADDDALRSAPYRYLAGLNSTVPVAGWTLEDGPLVTTGVPMYGVHAMQPFVGTHPSGAVITYPQWGRGTMAPWLPNVVSRSSSNALSVLWAQVEMPGFTTTWTVDLAYNSGTDAPISTVDVNPSYLGGALGWPQLSVIPVSSEVSVSFDGSPETNTTVSGLFDGGVHHVRWTASQSGANVTWNVYVDAVLVQSGTELTSTLKAITTIASTFEGGSSSVATGYLNVWTTPVAVADFTDAIFGHRGEQGHDRFARLAAEEGLTAVVYGSSSTRMGPQRTVPLWDLLVDIEEADQGMFFDAADDRAIAYRTRENMYAQTPVVAVIKGSLTKTLRPRWDRRSKANDWTLTRYDGATVNVSDEANVASTGRRTKRSLTVNVEHDELLPGHAAWRVAIGTAAGPRYTEGGLNLRNNDGAQLADEVLSLKPGDRITAAQAALPSMHSPVGLDQMILGWETNLGPYEWLVHLNMLPSSPYDEVGIYGADAADSRCDSDASTLAAGYSATATSFSVATTAGHALWLTGSGAPNFPIYWDIEGIRIRVDAISGSSSPQTATVVRSVDGYDKTLSSGSQVSLWDPARYGL